MPLSCDLVLASIRVEGKITHILSSLIHDPFLKISLWTPRDETFTKQHSLQVCILQLNTGNFFLQIGAHGQEDRTIKWLFYVNIMKELWICLSHCNWCPSRSVDLQKQVDGAVAESSRERCEDLCWWVMQAIPGYSQNRLWEIMFIPVQFNSLLLLYMQHLTGLIKVSLETEEGLRDHRSQCACPKKTNTIWYYMWNIKNDTNELIYKAEIDSQM